jgi:hypothetical protein
MRFDIGRWLRSFLVEDYVTSDFETPYSVFG